MTSSDMPFLAGASHVEEVDPNILRPGLSSEVNDYLQIGSCCVGDAQRIVSQAKRYQGQGFGDLLFIVQTGLIPHDKIMASLERFARDVMPEFVA